MKEIINFIFMGFKVELPTAGYYAIIKSAVESEGKKLKYEYNRGDKFVKYYI